MSVKDDIYNMVMDYICESEELGYCNNCPELRYESDIDTYDCPYGMSVDCCEYSPASLIDTDVEHIMLSIEACKP